MAWVFDDAQVRQPACSAWQVDAVQVRRQVARHRDAINYLEIRSYGIREDFLGGVNQAARRAGSGEYQIGVDAGQGLRSAGTRKMRFSVVHQSLRMNDPL
jgi:hypothetical protein